MMFACPFSAIVFLIFLLRFLLKRFPHNKVIIRINIFIKGIGEGFRTTGV